MLDISEILDLFFWPSIILVICVAVLGIAFVIYELLFGSGEKDLSVFQKRKYLFDTRSESELFKLLNELYSDRFYIFPQVHYSHIIEVKKNLPYSERFARWNSINRKSADFVLCDKERIVPQLVIELDGSSHELEKRKERDNFINDLMKITNFPILHLQTGNMDREFIKGEIERALL